MPLSINPYSTWDAATPTNEPDGLPDKRIVPLVEYLRSIGVITLQSCIGHKGYSDGTLWICADSVDEESIRHLFGTPFVFIKRAWWPKEQWEFVWFPWDAKQALDALYKLQPFGYEWDDKIKVSGNIGQKVDANRNS